MLKLSVEHAFGDEAPPPDWAAVLRQTLAEPPRQPRQACERWLQTLRQLARYALPPQERCQALSMLRDAILPQAAALEDWARAADPVGSAEARQALSLGRALLLRLHQDCKLLSRDCEEAGGGLFSGGRLRQEALALAFASAWDVQTLHARSYAPLPGGFWLDCHLLFACALSQGWERKTVAGGGDSLGGWYRRLLLLGMTASNRLDNRQQALLLPWIAAQARYLQLEQLAPGLPQQDGWLFAEAGDKPPRFVAEQPPEEGGSWWRADAGRTLDKLRAELNRLQAAGAPCGVESQLLARLDQEWRSPPRRRHARFRRFHSETVALLSQLPQCWRLAAGEGEPPVPAHLQLANLSASGLMLQGEALGQQLRAGELVMLRRKGLAWQLGLVRWLSLPGEELQTECGVELIGKRPQAVELAPLTSHAHTPFEPALLVQPERRFCRGGVLAAAGRWYQAQRPLLLRQGEEVRKVRAVRLLQQTASCQLMEIRVDEVLESGKE